MKVRIVAAEVTVTCHDGSTYSGWYRLAATLLNHRAFPAGALIALYHERWEHEITYLALRHTLLQGRVLRSGDPDGLRQEAWALLALYQALRTAITDAVQAAPGTDPDRASYQAAADAAQDLVITGRNITDPGGDLTGDIGRTVLARLNPPRRPRVCPRRIKSPLSRRNKHPQDKPTTSKKITQITSRTVPAHHERVTRRPKSLTNTGGP